MHSAWTLTGTLGGQQDDVYAQRVNVYGSLQWTPASGVPEDGIPVCTLSGNQTYPTITSDGFGGAIVTWADGRHITQYDIYAQRLNNMGQSIWLLDGDPVCTQPSGQNFPKIVGDDSGRAIIAWNDLRDGDWDVYAQRAPIIGSLSICYVSTSGDNSNVGTEGSPWRDIQYAVDHVADGGTVRVLPGTYNENVIINREHLTIESTGGAAVTTIEAADPYDDVLEITNVSYATVDGFTITGAEDGSSVGTIVYGYAGILLEEAHHCVIRNNTLTANETGLYLYQSSSNTIESNDASLNADNGILLYGSSYNSLKGNTANSNTNYGITTSAYGHDNLLQDNVVNNNGHGILIGNSSSETLTGNGMSGNTYNFGVAGIVTSQAEYTHQIDTTNTINGKAIYYLVGQTGGTIDDSLDPGFVACVYCDSVTVKNLNMSNNEQGILIVGTTNSFIHLWKAKLQITI